MPGHQPLNTGPNAFPRAELGLPIVFHFKDERAGDPTESELYPYSPYETGRMASPLIIKPLAVGDAGKAVPLILQLTTPPLTGVRLKKSPGNPEFGEEAIRSSDLTNYPNSPLKRGSAEGSALKAFIEHALRNGFQEVGR
jgi:CRISPR-associated protein Cmr1